MLTSTIPLNPFFRGLLQKDLRPAALPEEAA
jgi:hypothetical protein